MIWGRKNGEPPKFKSKLVFIFVPRQFHDGRWVWWQRAWRLRIPKELSANREASYRFFESFSELVEFESKYPCE